MASYDELIRALRNADAAGDADAARRIAARAQEARAQGDVAPTESLRPKARPQPGAQPPQQAPTAPQQPPQQAPTDPLLDELQRLMEVSPPTMQPQIQARIDEVKGQLLRDADPEPQQSLADLGSRFARAVSPYWYVGGLSPQDRPDGAPRPTYLTGELQRLMEVSPPTMQPQIQALIDEVEGQQKSLADLGSRFARGVTNIPASVPETAALLDAASPHIGGLSPQEPEKPVHERELFLAGDKIRQASLDIFGTPDPQFDDRFMGKLFEGAGSLAGFVVVTLFTGIGGGAAAGSALNASGMYRRAKQEGANEEQARTAAFLGSIVGASEVVPIGRGLNMLPSKMRERVAGAIAQRMANAFATAGEEGAQEALVGISNNLIAKGVYNPEQGVFNDVGAHSDTSDQVFRRHMISHSGVSDHPEMTPSGAVW